MGFMEDFDVVVSISALEFGLKEAGYQFDFGCGVAAALKVLLK